MSEPAASPSMFLGPVFNAELVTTSRRRRYYLARLAYGLVLLAMVASTYQGLRNESVTRQFASTPSYAFLAYTAGQIFTTFISTQVAAVLCVTPAMVAGTIADEKQRKTLHYLLASQLSSLEIVGGKLGARLLQLFVLVLTGLPIMSILSLFGGLDPPLVVAAFAGTLTTAFALAALSILVSTVSRRGRDAIVTVYILELVWLAAPTLVGAVLGSSSPKSLAFLGDLFDPILRLDPFQLVRLANPTAELPGRLAWMSGLQVTAGLLFLAIAVWRLRPSYAGAERGQAARQERSAGLLPRLFRRPGVGDDPMLWKEKHVARLGLVARVFGLLLGVFALVFLADAILDLGRVALAELSRFGYGYSPLEPHKARDELQGFLATAGAVGFLVWLPGVASSAASSVSSEREEDTWLSLLGTGLTGDEILRAKALGALWRWRVLGLLILGLWGFGLAFGAVHPLGLVLTLALFAAATAFAVSLGLNLSLRARTTTRATVATVLILFVLNGGYLMCLFPMADSGDILWLAPISAYGIYQCPARYGLVQTLFGQAPANAGETFDKVVAQALTWGVSVAGYSLGAVLLSLAALNDFDRIAGRPRRPRGFSAALADSIEIEAREKSGTESAATPLEA